MPTIATGTMEGLEEERNGEIGEVSKYNPVWMILLLTSL